MNSAKFISVWIAVALVTGLAAGCDPKTPKTPKTQAPVAAVADARAASAPQPHNLPDFSALVQEVGPAIVNIRAITESEGAAQASNIPKDDPLYDFFRRFGSPDARREPTQGMGSGLIVTENGLILTNAHVVQGASDVTVKLTDRREFKARVVGADRRSDIAVLKIDATALPTVKIGDPEKIRVGEWVAAIGSPFGLENSVTSGIVSAKSRSLPDSNYVPFIQTDVAVNPGSSGGPLLNMQGEVIGINSQIYSRTGGYQGLSFAIPIDLAIKIKDQLQRYGKVSRGHLGVAIQELNQSLAESFGLKKADGALVANVGEGGPAAKAGLQAGDVIVGFNGKPIANSAELPLAVADVRPGETARIRVWRKGSVKDLAVVVGEAPQERVATRLQR